MSNINTQRFATIAKHLLVATLALLVSLSVIQPAKAAQVPTLSESQISQFFQETLTDDQVVGLTGQTLSSGHSFSCGVTKTGAVKCWGNLKDYGLTQDLAVSDAIQVAAGYQTCVLSRFGRVKCFGSYVGQDASKVDNLRDIVQISSRDAACAVNVSGKVFCWGWNVNNNTAVPANLPPIAAVSVGDLSTCAITKSDHNVVCWSNGIGTIKGWEEVKVSVPEGLGAVRQIVSLGMGYCALKMDYSVTCWTVQGYFSSDFENFKPEGKFKYLTAGGGNICGVTVEDFVRCWADNNYSKFPSDLTYSLGPVIDFTSSTFASCAVQSTDGNVLCFGSIGGKDSIQRYDYGRLSTIDLASIKPSSSLNNGKAAKSTLISFEAGDTLGANAAGDAHPEKPEGAFEGAVTSIASAPTGGNGGKALKIEKQANAQPWAGARILYLDSTQRITDASQTIVTFNYFSPKANSPVRVEIAGYPRSLGKEIYAPRGWSRVTVNFTDVPTWSADESYSELWIFPDFNQSAGATSQAYFVDDIAFNGAETPALPSVDTSLSRFEINGTPVTEGSIINLGPLVDRVGYSIQTNHPDATFVVEGAEDLVEGENILRVTVTAADTIKVLKVDTNSSSSCALSDLGSVSCWGENYEGQLDVPNDLGPATDVQVGWGFACALKVNAQVVCWGRNFDGQDQYPLEPGGFKSISLNGYQICAITLQGYARCWGDLRTGVNDIPSDLGQVDSIATGYGWACATKLSGYIQCWGMNQYKNSPYYDESYVSETLNAPVSDEFMYPKRLVAGTFLASCAISSLDNLACWGKNSALLHIPANLGRVKDITIGDHSACAITLDNLVKCWGDTSYGVIDLPAQKDQFVQISLGGTSGCATTVAQTIKCWSSDTRVKAPPADLFPPNGRTQVFTVTLNVEAAPPVVPELSPDTPKPSVYGVPVAGEVVAGSTVGWDEGVSFEYQWFRDGVVIDGAVSASYKLTGLDAGHSVSVLVTGSKQGYLSKSLESDPVSVGLGTQVWSQEPELFGEAKVPSSMTVRTSDDYDAAFEYQWFRNGRAVDGATASSYEFTAQDAGTTMRVLTRVRVAGFKDAFFTSRSFIVSAGSIVPLSSPAISGVAKVGGSLTADLGSWPAGVVSSVQWFRGANPITSATKSTYVLTAADYGHQISIRVKATLAGFDASVAYADADVVELGDLVAGVPVVSGAALVGKTVKAGTGSWPAGTALSFQWFADGQLIPEASKSSLYVGSSLLGKTIQVRVSGSKEGYHSVEKLSAGVVVPLRVLKALVAPKLQGSFTVGTNFVVDPGVYPAGVDVKLVWLRNGVEFATTSATDNSYALTAADVQKQIAVQVVASAPGHKDLVVTKSKLVKHGKWTGSTSLTVTGQAKLGATVSAMHTVYPEGSTIKYFWFRDGAKILGAYGQSYVIKDKDLGKAITAKPEVSAPGYLKFNITGPAITPTR